MTRREKHIGDLGQNIAASVLSGMGIHMVEKIGTPVRLIPVGARKDVFRVIWGERVSGDHRGILDNGTSVLAETKTIFDRNLHYSDLREHQPARLAEHARHGGLSLLVWVHDGGVYVMRFPIDGFREGKSIDVEWAEREHEKTLEHLRTLLVPLTLALEPAL